MSLRCSFRLLFHNINVACRWEKGNNCKLQEIHSRFPCNHQTIATSVFPPLHLYAEIILNFPLVYSSFRGHSYCFSTFACGCISSPSCLFVHPLFKPYFHQFGGRMCAEPRNNWLDILVFWDRSYDRHKSKPGLRNYVFGCDSKVGELFTEIIYDYWERGPAEFNGCTKNHQRAPHVAAESETFTLPQTRCSFILN